jgi:xanthine/uracil permease
MRNKTKLILATAALLAIGITGYSQTVNFQTIDSTGQAAATTMRNIIGYILWAVIAAGLLVGVYLILFNSERTKQAIVAIVVALIVAGVGFQLQIL